MTSATSKSMNLLLEKNEDRINAKVHKKMKKMIREISIKLNMSDSQYIKLAISERLEKDIIK